MTKKYLLEMLEEVPDDAAIVFNVGVRWNGLPDLRLPSNVDLLKWEEIDQDTQSIWVDCCHPEEVAIVDIGPWNAP